MYDENYYINLVVDMIMGDPFQDLPRELFEPMVDEDVLQDYALTLRRNYPNDVQQGRWISMDLRRGIDMILDEDNPMVNDVVFGEHFFSESERQEILNRCAAAVCKKLQRCIGADLKVCYKVMPNGRVGYRLE